MDADKLYWVHPSGFIYFALSHIVSNLISTPSDVFFGVWSGTTLHRLFESEAPVAEEMLDRVICSREQFSFQMRLESGDGSGTFRNWRQRVPDSWCHDTECFGLKVDPCCRLIE